MNLLYILDYNYLKYIMDYNLHDAFITLVIWVNNRMHVFKLFYDLLQGKITQDEESR